MHASEPIAYTHDGAAYCADCEPDAPADETDVVFADQEYDVIGWACDACGACYVEGDGWTAHEDAVNPRYTRWAVCRGCNHHHPMAVGGYNYRRARVESRQGKLRCPNCLGTLHF